MDLAKLSIVLHAGGIEFAIKAVPGAARQRVAGLLGDALKVAVSAPPEDGKANAAIEQFIAGVLNLRRTAVRVVSGHASPRKRLRAAGISAEEARHRLSAACG